MSIAYIHTQKGLSLVLRNKQYTVASDAKDFQHILGLVMNGANEELVEQELRLMERKVQAATKLSPNLEYKGGTVFYKNVALHNYAIDKLLAFLDQQLPIAPIVNFIERVMKNPSFRVVQNLYAFLEHGGIPLTNEGKFVAYKAIRPDWTDIYTGKIDNSIGAVVEVPRNNVDEDPDRTCSYGLHVCSFDYLPHFAHRNGHVVLCEVDPADVVAIPADYNNTKMRCCKYKVIGEVSDYYTKNEDVLRTTNVWDTPRKGDYTVRVTDNGLLCQVRNFETLEEAENWAEDLIEDGFDEANVYDSGDELLSTFFAH